MIAVWMLSALLFTALLGVAAHSGEIGLRAAGRQGRWPWVAAAGAGVAWPFISVMRGRAATFNADMIAASVQLPSIQVLPSSAATLLSSDAVSSALAVLWTALSVVLLVRAARALVLLRRLGRGAHARVIDDVEILVSDTIGPAVIGVLQPRVLLPESLLALDAPLRRLILRHEAEHCSARDPWLVLGSTIALAVVPWNLPLWWIVRRARLALEIDCDARVLAGGADARSYGRLLLLVAQQHALTAYAPMLAASRSHLERRIAAMRSVARPRRVRAALGLTGAALAVAAACTSRVEDGSTAPRVSVREPASDAMLASPVAVPNGRPMFEFQVDHGARLLPNTALPEYPAALRGAKIEGKVLAQFVLDTSGRYVPGTFKVLMSSHEQFTRAVANALPALRFRPAEVRGRRVKQLLQVPFTFAPSAH